ncbi:MAG: FAD-dependent oxidoreductase [Caldisericia bacterium]|jgi:NADPH-dependent 2,4-dienoyl-CoA reductase/sulfur reductase-like enzyme
MRVLIVGGNAGGASVATRLRRLRPDVEVVVFERGQYVSYANCGLLYYLEGTIADRSALFVETADSLRSKYGIDVRLQSEVVGIDPSAHTITVHNAATDARSIEHYDKLVLAMGAEPVWPQIPGIDGENVIPMWSIPHMDRIAALVQGGAHSAVILGGGYVGCVMAEALHKRGLNATIVEEAAQTISFVDPDIAVYAQQELEKHGISVRLGQHVERFSARAGGGQTAVLAGGGGIDADFVVVAIGVRPLSRIARDAGLAIGDSGGIVVSPSLRTSDPDVYAVGDAIEVTHTVSGVAMAIPLAGPAHQQARIAAANIAGVGGGWSEQYPGTQGSSVLKLFDISCGSTGANSAQLQRRNILFNSILIHPMSHAAYYPGAFPIHLKLLYGSDGRVLGAQAAGRDGIAKRIDVIATAIYFGAHVRDLDNLQLCYSPPFSSARDPVNVAGSVAKAHLTSEDS